MYQVPALTQREKDLLTQFYEILATEDNEALKNFYAPRSEVYYVRAALEAKFPDRKFTLQEVEDLLKEQGIFNEDSEEDTE